MSKLALVVRRSDFQQLIETFPNPRQENEPAGRWAGFWDEEMYKIPTQLLPREQVENDPTYLQIIPYVLLVKPDVTGLDIEYLTYSRGKKGNETRLHGLRSMGIGGHLEEAVTEQKDLFSVIWDGFLRELKEETGVELTEVEISMVRDEIRKNLRWIYTNVEPVNEVHLGVTFAIFKQQYPDLTMEAGVLEDPVWMTMEDMINRIVHNGFTFEPWSDMLLSITDQESREGISYPSSGETLV